MIVSGNIFGHYWEEIFFHGFPKATSFSCSITAEGEKVSHGVVPVRQYKYLIFIYRESIPEHYGFSLCSLKISIVLYMEFGLWIMYCP